MMNNLSTNPYINIGYRKNNENLMYYCKSIFKIHNQTCLLMLCIFRICISIYFYCIYNLNINYKIQICFNLCLISSIIQSIFSFIYHLFAPHKYSILFRTFDLYSILLCNILNYIISIIIIKICINIFIHPINNYFDLYIYCYHILFLYSSCAYIQNIRKYNNVVHIDKSVQLYFTICIITMWYIFILIISYIVDNQNIKQWGYNIGIFLLIGGILYKYRFPECVFQNYYTAYIFYSHALLHVCIIISNISLFKFIYLFNKQFVSFNRNSY